MSKRDELAAVLAWSSGEFTRWSPDAHPDHNHWSWQGNGHGEGARRPFREQADAVLAWLGEQFGEGSVSAMTVEERCGCGASIRVTSTVVGSTLTRWRDEHHCSLPPKPGLCFVAAPAIWPGGITPRCELRAGHAGAHECDRGLIGRDCGMDRQG